MIVIRGGTTIIKDSAEQIVESTQELLNEIISRNRLDTKKIVAIFFTATKDIKSDYPAKAARLMGFDKISLMCFQEMDVENSLKLCIRMSLFYDSELVGDIKHVYLKEASSLRPDLL